MITRGCASVVDCLIVPIFIFMFVLFLVAPIETLLGSVFLLVAPVEVPLDMPQ